MESILQLLFDTARRCPDRCALSAPDHQLTFAQLRDKALATGIAIRRHYGPLERIGVLVRRSIRTPALFLGALCSGACYVPLDPEMPGVKLRKILADSQISLILTEEPSELPPSAEYQGDFLTWQEIPQAPSAEEEAQLLQDLEQVSAGSPLYLIYTSGSTGEPKGVIKSHRAMLTFLESFTAVFPLSQEEVMGNQTPFYFDASAKDLYLMLKTGATLEVLPVELFTFPVRLIEYLNQRQITMISWVPSALSLVTQLNTFEVVLPTTLRRVFFVGEVFPMKQLNKWRKVLPQLEYVNLYGSTEVAGVSCCYPVAGEYADSDVLPIGRPLPGYQVTLMKDGQPVTQPGVIGELVISGDALADGYTDPEKTARAFFSLLQPDGGILRSFHTGDLALYREDGNLVFATREDNQIKHMGHRIELGEIEAAANAIPEMVRCCCLYHREKNKIVLFCQLDSGSPLTARDLRRNLQERLSRYMLPNRFVLLETLPLNANGKIHREKLKELL